VIYTIRFSRQAEKDIKKLTPKLRDKLKDILRNKIANNPYSGKPLTGNLKSFYSARLTYQDRIVYSIHDDQLIVMVIRAKTHYGE
jgi:Txe/YoeB family toxin of toxin-antitoxin system